LGQIRFNVNAFDFDTISDVIIKLNYTAREGGEILKKAAKQAVKNAMLMQTKPHLHDYSVRNTSFHANGIWVVEAKNADIH
jgi:hypothetical protein